jgi:preprotein translocase subunit SecB
MSSSPLQLESCRLISISVEAVPDAGKGRNISISAKVELGQAQDNARRWRMVLTVTLAAESPYTGHVSVEGFFTVLDSFPDENMQKLVAVNGASILYGSAREFVSNLTSRSTNGELLLPSMSFLELSLEKADNI